MYRYRSRRKPRSKPAPVKAPVQVVSTPVHHGISAQAKIGRYKGGSTTRAYDSSHHLKSAKTTRRKARETKRKKLSKRKPRNRYKQLM